MYVVVRGDLSPGLQMAQALHAAFTFAVWFPQHTKEWMDSSNYLVVLQTKNEAELQELLEVAKEQNIICASFCEPDIDNQLTAICLGPSEASRKLCRNLKLALNK
jgi:peptidyl-tRNA hydrolase